MIYMSNEDLPAFVRTHLPRHAQYIFRAAFNHAWLACGTREAKRREEVAHCVAWSAVKRSYHNVGNTWEPNYR